MRRFVALLLLALLPMQFSWAAVSAYCQHEADAQTQHLGHHEHPQHADAGDADGHDADTDAPAASNGIDCGHCHAGALALTQPAPALHVVVGAAAPQARAEGRANSLAPLPPERPQWAALA
jgi:hypothetical protein